MHEKSVGWNLVDLYEDIPYRTALVSESGQPTTRWRMGVSTRRGSAGSVESARAFDEVFRGQGIEIVRTPIQASQANAYAERFVGTVRRECLDWILIASRRQLERVLGVYLDHYNGHRPHRGLGLVAPQPRPGLRPGAPPHPLRVPGRDRLGGLIHEYSAAA